MKEIIIRKKYLIFPVNTYGKYKQVKFKSEGNTVYRLNVKLDAIAPDFHAFVDMSRFMGMTLALIIDPWVEVEIGESDTMDLPNLYSEPFRPTVHFTTKNGWINDPNGLIYLDGIYHMFYQHNPCEPNWENMHWGHAVSTDLLHWEEQDIALYPDDGGLMYSGSAIQDTNNLLGLQAGETPTTLLFYTSTKPFMQNIAYSTDGLKTIHKYEGNPVVPKIIHGNRDPKVVFCEELNAYVMALYLKGNNNETYALLKSRNLTEWTLLQEIEMAGENECPDFFSLLGPNGEKKWVLMGARNRYLVGDFKRGTFIPCQPILGIQYNSRDYAGQTFSNLPDGRIVRMTWDRWTLHTPPFSGQMGIPMELHLEKHKNTYLVTVHPIEELKKLVRRTQITKIPSSDTEECVLPMEDAATLIDILGDYPTAGTLSLKVFGISLTFDFEKGICIGDKNKELFPISLFKDRFELHMLIDRCSTEIFLDGGRVFSCLSEPAYIPDRNIPVLRLKSTAPFRENTVLVSSLESIWNKEN
ncbi:MAG: glycoside hydrolase family 32 protein [Clostridia bacterium]|nr:glycoside hydrolase family 32 protein [Clostridia bacterium]